jgi:hypothetical protein
MERAWVKYWVDIGILISFIIAGITGIAKMPQLLPKLGLSISTIITMSWLHDWAGVAMVVLAAIHVALHWKWIVAMTKRLWVRKQ